MDIPEIKERDSDVAYRLPGNALIWALECAFGLGQYHSSIGKEKAARMVVYSMAVRNMIHIEHSHWVGCTKHVDSAVPLRATQTEYEG